MNSNQSGCIQIGVAGGIGSGKSTVCKVIEQLGYPVFYSDQEGKKLMVHDPKMIKQVKAIFGPEAYINNDLNRPFLAEKVFQNRKLLSQLNDIVHPAVREAFNRFTELNCEKKLIFNEAAILFETGAFRNFDVNILVIAPKNIRISRIMTRDNTSQDQVISRMNNQWEDDKKIPLADYVIHNSDSDDLEPQIKEIITHLKDKFY